MREQSSTTVEIISVDEGAVTQAIDEYVREISARPEVEEIVLFGSWATGRYAPGSDVDLLVVLVRSNEVFRDRIPRFMPAKFPIDVDVFPYTVAEIERIPFAREAREGGRTLWRRRPVVPRE
jgi:predicted nucleotidyltransferase